MAPLRVEIELDVEARMRDGTMLRADVYRPTRDGPWPTLLTRTPYGKHVVGETAWTGLDPVQAARRGFMVVLQDTRGRFASGGQWDPLRFERQDGYDSIEWAALLRGSNGRVGLFGGSYCGNTQLMPALDRPPALAAMSPLMTWSEPDDGLLARGGAVELGLGLAWSVLTGFDYLTRTEDRPDELQRRIERLIEDWDHLGSIGYQELPVRGHPLPQRHGIPDLGNVRATRPDVGESSRVAGSHHRINAPSLHTGGWYDVFLQGTLDNYVGMAAAGVESRLVVGPWSHERFLDPVGEQTFGLAATRDGVPVHPHGDWNESQLAWFRRYVGADPSIEFPQTTVRIFVMGRNEWRDESSWPPTRAVTESWFMRAGGRLTPQAPGSDEPPTEYSYDPADPVPTLGGNIVMWPGYPVGPVDQQPIEARDDVLVFTSDPLEHDLEVTGRVRVVLNAETSAVSTDWVARLCDVHPDGRSINVCDGILRTAEPDAAEPYVIDLWSTSIVFRQGHRMRVHVTSSSFPRWDRNLNTGDQLATRHLIARQRIRHDSDSASHIDLPVIK